MRGLWMFVLLSVAAPVLAAEGKDIWAGSPYEPTDVSMELVQVSTHAYYVQGPPGVATENQGFISNAGVVVTDDGVVVFDALGTPSLAYQLLGKIRAISDQPIRKVVVSHYHADHIYGLQVFKALGVEIIAPRGALEYMRSDQARNRLQERRESLFPWVNEDTQVVKPDVVIAGRQGFQLGGIEFEIIPLGSTHSDGDQMMLVKNDGVLFSGDLIFEGRIPLVAGSQPNAWLTSLKNFNTDGLKVIVPGHGSASTHPAKALAFTRDYLQFLHDGMARAVANLQSFDEAYAAMDWSRYENLPASVANRLNANYVYLSLEAASLQE